MRNSLAVQWLGLHALTAEGLGSIPGQEAKIPHAAQHDQKNLHEWVQRQSGEDREKNQ